MSDELERLLDRLDKQNASAKRGHPKYIATMTSADELTLTTGLRQLLSERRELVAGLREALEIANWPASEGSARLRQGQRIAKLSALAARIAPNQEGEK